MSVDGHSGLGNSRRVDRELPAGLTLRAARPSDLDGIASLLVARGEPADAIDHRLIVDDPDAGLDCCGVVVDGERVVSTMTLLDETLILDDVSIRAGQVDLVATDPDYEGRGLVRALMRWAHESFARRGRLVQLVVGIAYFYRQFGYQYSVAVPRARAVAARPPLPGGYLVRWAGHADIGAMARLQDATQRDHNLRMPHSPACWRWLVARQGSRQLIVEHDGAAVATGRITPPDDGCLVLGEVAADSAVAVEALLAHAVALAGEDELRVHERPGGPAGKALESHLAPPPAHTDCYYTRVPDVVALLRHLAPVFSARLAASDLTRDRGEAVVSFFRYHVRLAYENGAVNAVHLGGRMQAPGSAGGAGVAPDLVAPLLFGPHGIAGLAERHPDVYLGPNEALMRVLFPPVRADLLTLYLP